MISIVSVAEWIIKSLVLITIILGGFAYLTLFERRALARMQARIGPNRAGPAGLLQPVADGIKLMFKEELIPDRADKVLFVLAPIITVVPVLLLLAVIPLGPDIEIFGQQFSLGLASEIDVGVLFILAVASIAVYGIVIAGWSSYSKYSLLGALRASAQMISYELALGLAIIGPILLAGSLSVADIVADQQRLWYVVLQPIGFLIFLIASMAEINRAPFDMSEAEQELTGGYHTEYSGMKFAVFFMAEYGKMIAVSFVAATLFLGGYWGPFVDRIALLGPIYLFAKVVAILFLMIWIRATWPRLRYDRLMAFGWKILLPVGLLNVVITGGLIVVLNL
ncbi:MAG: NADH-quinone oxidoreductase subunit NuoH [Chloroflexi bacterium]|nr:NADH-quinone oxidoreductase subunit NuoH [Chloroflexota bacterium]MDK1044145.1 NADH-quinone oxidoreductase subunit NuoH [Anaerolineales bacterium]MCH8094131.1 NADH-quinone oxidoreductase subunit NuoH [Chloroflexota bacterium]MCH8338811.1 NADH-quinone oxidoreductase subunit NuoH [Chloroflexota bacterium]MCH8340467.1 NADH-quinone oxidoreductase subunit NuoH [Chloroflexota bacterium]